MLATCGINGFSSSSSQGIFVGLCDQWEERSLEEQLHGLQVDEFLVQYSMAKEIQLWNTKDTLCFVDNQSVGGE